MWGPESPPVFRVYPGDFNSKTIMILFFWLLNFVISWFNAWSVGKTWTETKAVGGPVHFMSWMGAIMAAVGFTWCYSVILGYGAATIPLTDEETGVSAPLLSIEEVEVFFDLAYLIYIFPLIGSGMAIMTHSWGVFWRRRSLGSGVTAGWNTYAQLHNFYHAVQHVPVAFDNVGSFFKGSSDNKDGKGLIILLLAAVSVLGGVLTTWAIIRRTARDTAFSRREKYEQMAEEAANAG